MNDTQTWEGKATELREALVRTSREMWLASLGAVVTMSDEALTVFETLVERGKAVEARTDTTVVARAVGGVEQRFKDIERRVEDGLHETSRKVLHRFGVPSHAEVQTLITRVEQLSAKIDTMARKEVADVQKT